VKSHTCDSHCTEVCTSHLCPRPHAALVYQPSSPVPCYNVCLVQTQLPSYTTTLSPVVPKQPRNYCLSFGSGVSSSETQRAWTMYSHFHGQWTLVQSYINTQKDESRAGSREITVNENSGKVSCLELSAASMMFRDFWDVAPCSHVEVDPYSRVVTLKLTRTAV
jgi:hypothetical protein